MDVENITMRHMIIVKQHFFVEGEGLPGLLVAFYASSAVLRMR
jgi:hypothetical protein